MIHVVYSNSRIVQALLNLKRLLLLCKMYEMTLIGPRSHKYERCCSSSLRSRDQDIERRRAESTVKQEKDVLGQCGEVSVKENAMLLLERSGK